MLPIIIPTVGRPRCVTMEFLTPEVQRHVTFLTNKAEQRSLSQAYPLAVVMHCPHQPEPGEKIDLRYKGISHVRQWAMKQWAGQRVIMSDDDIPIYVRKNPKDWTDWHARRATPEEVTKALEKMSKLSEKHAMVGMSSKQGNNNHKAPIVYATRMHNIWTIDFGIANREGFRFDSVPTMQDFWMHLCFLTAGYETAMICDYMHCQAGSNITYKTKSGGGCSLFRSIDTQIVSSRALATEWPDFVKLVYKKTVGKSTWFGGQERPEVLVQWKKALAYGLTKRNPLL
jgi:hypothetical protein